MTIRLLSLLSLASFLTLALASSDVHQPQVRALRAGHRRAAHSFLDGEELTEEKRDGGVKPTPAGVFQMERRKAKATACAPVYASATATIRGPGTLPKTSVGGFVKKSGTGLTLGGKKYRIVGPNIYWLGLDENVGIAYPSKNRTREAIAIAVAMGANTVRSHTLGISTGNSLSVWPTRGQTNTAAFDSIDYAIYVAGQYGIRLVIPLTDNYQYYHGGKFDFLRWRGYNISAPGVYKNFYNQTTVINDYKQYISTILNRVNQYNGIAYKNDPTILAWETANEFGAYDLKEGAPPQAWTTNIASYIKSVAPNQLVVDGTSAIYYPGTTSTVPGLRVSQIDISTDHFYPVDSTRATNDYKYTSASSANKNALFGEFDWTPSNIGSWLNTVEKSTPNAGDMLWSLFGHDDTCCAFVTHNDSYSLYYPNGNTAALQTNILTVVQHWHRLSGRTAPTRLNAVACPQPNV